MRTAPLLHSATLAVLGVGVSNLPAPAVAASSGFSNTEIDQSRVVAIASPYGNALHQLLIVEQLNNARPCWSESGTSPTNIDPLLTKFDFTGICGRSTDSNGYSLRVGGQDLGWRYSLRVVRRQGDLKLVAVPTASRTAPEFEIGSANGITDGFAKIQLNPGWRMTKRVYNGKTLGHIYLTTEQSMADLIASASSRPSAPTPVVTRPPATPPSTSQPLPSTGTVDRPSLPTPGNVNRPLPSAGNTNRPSLPTPPRPNQTGSTGVTVPPAANTPGREIEFNIDPTLNANSGTDLPTVAVTPTPSARPSGGNYTGTPAASSNLAQSLGFNYRVIVPATDATTQARVRSLVPGAFRTTINGQVVMQAGVFKDRGTADQLQQQLSQRNVRATVIPINPSGVSQNQPSTVVGI